MGLPLKSSYDVVIAGGGPAGSSLAIRLALAGRSVLVAEQKRFPREKLCGEFISPECLSHFDKLGILPAITSQSSRLTETVFYARSGRHVEVPSEWFGADGAVAIGLSRAEMDEQLLRRAAGLGVDVCEDAAAIGVLGEGDWVTGLKIRVGKGDDLDIAAKLVVDATGRSRSIARQVGPAGKAATRAQHVAFKTHLEGVSIPTGVCEIYGYSGGYGGCNLVEGGTFNLCFIVTADDAKRAGSDPGRVMREVVFTNPRARDAMKDAVAVDPWLAVPIQRFGRGTLAPRAGLVTVGDSAAFIDPFTGSGILLALQSTKILADAIERHWANGVSSICTQYQSSYSAAFDNRLRWSSMLRRVSFNPWAAEALVAGLGISTTLRKSVARMTRHSVDNV
jgi:flavin-dependent dehydrogenase